METKKTVQLEAVSQTLLIPLSVRAKETEQSAPIVVDQKARH